MVAGECTSGAILGAYAADVDPELPAEDDHEPLDLQTVEEIQAHFEGPVATVFAWVEAVAAGDWRAVWRLSDDSFRLVRAQAWLWNNRHHAEIDGEDLDQLAAGLAVEDPEGELWEVFARLELAQFQAAWADWDLTNLGAASRPRPVGLDYEVVLLMRAGADPILITAPTPVTALRFLTHLVNERWLVANAGSDERLEPGWPPTLG